MRYCALRHSARQAPQRDAYIACRGEGHTRRQVHGCRQGRSDAASGSALDVDGASVLAPGRCGAGYRLPLGRPPARQCGFRSTCVAPSTEVPWDQAKRVPPSWGRGARCPALSPFLAAAAADDLWLHVPKKAHGNAPVKSQGPVPWAPSTRCPLRWVSTKALECLLSVLLVGSYPKTFIGVVAVVGISRRYTIGTWWSVLG